MSASIAIPAISLWPAVARTDVESRWTSAAIINALPAIASRSRAGAAKASSNSEHATRKIAASTATAAGSPGCASLLIVWVAGW